MNLVFHIIFFVDLLQIIGVLGRTFVALGDDNLQVSDHVVDRCATSWAQALFLLVLWRGLDFAACDGVLLRIVWLGFLRSRLVRFDEIFQDDLLLLLVFVLAFDDNLWVDHHIHVPVIFEIIKALLLIPNLLNLRTFLFLIIKLFCQILLFLIFQSLQFTKLIDHLILFFPFQIISLNLS